MRKQKKSILVLAVITAFVATGFFLPQLIGAGELEPPGPPGPTMKTLDEIPPTWSQLLPADDGDPANCGSSRFDCVMGGEAVLDKETGLVWARDANIYGTKQWVNAVTWFRNGNIGNRKGWRLPTVEELSSLLDIIPGGSQPFPSGHPFENMTNDYYWSSTPCESSTDKAWAVGMGNGGVNTFPKDSYYYMWPVRGGAGPILVPHTPPTP